MANLLKYFKNHENSLVTALREMVEIESPTLEPDSVNEMGTYVQSRLKALGARIELDKQQERGDNVIGRFGPDNGKKPVLLIGHMDTVLKAGTLRQRPFRVDNGKAYGPGTADMKSGLVIMLAVLEAVHDLELELARPVTLIFNSDEEMQSKFSRTVIFREAKKSEYALVFEGSDDVSTFTTQRKSSGRFTIRTYGRASHAGAALAEGVNAIEELARQVIKAQRMTDFEVGTTVNVGTISGGDRPNIVPDYAEAHLSVRAPSVAEMERIETELVALELEAILPGAKVEVEGGFHRFPFENTPANQELFRSLQSVAAKFDLEAKGRLAGGSSDANLTSGVGTPTIDGMGAVGFGAHSIDEHIILESLPVRAAIATDLIISR